MARITKLSTSKKDSAKIRKQTENLINEQGELAELTKTPPKHIRGTKAGYAWAQIVPELLKMGYVKALDKDVIILLCINIQLYKEAFESIAKDGLQQKIFETKIDPTTGNVISKDFCGWKKNPSVDIIQTATTKIESLSNKLGLSPTARASILAKVEIDHKEEETLADILNR